ncbi:MAG: Tetratricopeptide repeat protein [Candidatus Methanofastidiosum methylothiophilum]|uniref:Tetratricopeptide repeat protein n=1 Tax=Candidatus Methanofastidiosum methylothiophilum TaxID=1705564 RepID=A0A150IPV0_9EURY|nr:MAG: Tetratricopeptide repeat protein [Candidatus Methanofastidiosum methylthiophilus]
MSPVLSEAFYEEAVKCYEKVTTINPEFKEAWYKKGIALEKLGEGSKAKKCFEIAKELGHVSNPI